MKKLQTAWAALFLAAWWLPGMLAAAGARWPGAMPLPLSFLSKVATLFAYRQERWLVHYVEVRFAGSEAWTAIPEEILFGSTMFGSRSRLQRLLDQTQGRPEAGARMRAELALWIGDRLAQLPGGRPAAVRFVDATYVPAEHPAGSSYVAPPVEAYHPDRLTMVSVHPL